MTYKKIIKEIAKNNNTSKKEVETQMRSALKASGINISPELVIELIASKIKKDYIS